MSDTELGRESRGGRTPAAPSGFTLLEVVMVAVLLMIAASMAYPRVASRMAEAHAVNAARVVASDLREALALAARQGTPMRVEFDAGALELRLEDRGTGNVVHRRGFGSGTEFPLSSASTSTSSIDVFPNRVTSGPISITLVTPARSMRVIMTRAALITIQQL
jgi:prepilin-type N-terminal cleavage/methylation domain-containing protein